MIRYIALLLVLLPAGGCVSLAREPAVAQPGEVAAPPATAPPPAAATPPAAAPRPVAGKPPVKPVAPAKPQPARPPAPTARATRPAPPPAAARPRTGVAPATLDLDALEAQLKATKAIGVFTKISLKNQVDDLMQQFRDYYQGKSKLTMSDLRRSYNLLMMKVLTLLQDEDKPLASAIVSSREAIWSLLANPTTFATLQS